MQCLLNLTVLLLTFAISYRSSLDLLLSCSTDGRSYTLLERLSR